MKKAGVFLFLCFRVSLFCLSIAQDESRDPSSKISTHLDFRGLFPGEVVKVSVKSESEVKRAQVRFGGKIYSMGKGTGPGELFALIGLDLGIKPGSYPLDFTVVFADGTYERKKSEIMVMSKDFPVRKLWVDEKYVIPPKDVLQRIQEESEILRSVYAIFTPEWLGDGAFVIPSEGEVVPNFGERRFFNNKPRSSHSGMDISSPFGASVKASNSGRVVLASDLYFAGKTVIIDHGLGVFSLYCHFSRIRVERGDFALKGDVVGEIGSTGRVTGPHLHWGIKIQGSRIDPFSLLSLSFSP